MIKKDMIANTIWNIGENKYNDLFSDQIYEFERGENVAVPGETCSGEICNDTVTRTTSWTGKIGIMYPSDYGYATDFTNGQIYYINFNSTAKMVRPTLYLNYEVSIIGGIGKESDPYRLG